MCDMANAQMTSLTDQLQWTWERNYDPAPPPPPPPLPPTMAPLQYRTITPFNRGFMNAVSAENRMTP